MKYEILEHRADLKIRVFGKTKKELFENAMIGMFESVKYKPTTNNKQLTTKIKISSLDLTSLLVDFLSEILYLAETRKEVYQKVNFKKFSETPKQNKFATGQTSIEAELVGKKLKRMEVHIKAITYHDLEIFQKDGLWQTTILFDI